MKKSVVLFMLVTLFSQAGNFGVAQSIKIGLKGGLSVANQKFTGGTGSFTPDGKVRPHMGLFVSVKPTSSLAIQPELLFAGQGYGKLIGSFPEEGVNYNYLTIPVMIKYHPVGMFNVHAGPQLGFLIGGDSFNGVSVTEDARTAELALAFGAELYPVDKVGLGVRYVTGLTNVYNGSGADEITVTNRTIQFSLLIPLF